MPFKEVTAIYTPEICVSEILTQEERQWRGSYKLRLCVYACVSVCVCACAYLLEMKASFIRILLNSKAVHSQRSGLMATRKRKRKRKLKNLGFSSVNS